jgi:hypothetical protein
MGKLDKWTRWTARTLRYPCRCPTARLSCVLPPLFLPLFLFFKCALCFQPRKHRSFAAPSSTPRHHSPCSSSPRKAAAQCRATRSKCLALCCRVSVSDTSTGLQFHGCLLRRLRRKHVRRSRTSSVGVPQDRHRCCRRVQCATPHVREDASGQTLGRRGQRQ